MADLGGAAWVARLRGLKENVILGHLVPAGTGFKAYHDKAVKKLGEPVERIERGNPDAPPPSIKEDPLAALAREAGAGSEIPPASLAPGGS